MGEIVPVELDMESSPGRYGPDSGGRLVNAYPEKVGEKGKLKYPIYCMEGMNAFSTLIGGGRVRGAIEMDGFGYVVAGIGVFKVDSDGNATSIGTFGGSNPVFMARNRNSTPQIMMVCDGLRYQIASDTVEVIADSDLPAANSVTFLEGYFVATIEDGRFFISEIDDVTSWDALDFEEAQGVADALLVGYARGREVILFGAKSIEFWAHTGAATFPLEPVQSAFIRNLGIMCRHSVKDINDVVFFVASDGTVRMMDGYSPQRISIHAVERSIASIVDKDTITATAYSMQGHQFYILSSPEWTWTYDGLNGVWHERLSYNETRWRGETSVIIENKIIVGDFEAGSLVEMSTEAQDEAGEHLIWKVVTPPIHGYPQRVCMDRLFVDTIPGTGINSSDEHAANPDLMMRRSVDGGKTWSNERRAGTGRIGEYGKRVVFSQLGESGEDGMVIELSMSAPVRRAITGIAAEVEPLEA